MSPLDYALHPHINALQRAQNVTPHLYNTDYYAALLPRRGRILRRTLSVRLSVRPSRYHYRASRRAT